MARKIYINGKFTVRSPTGVDRYALEIVKAMDPLVSRGELVLLVPSNAINVPDLDNISVKELRGQGNILWEQFTLPIYVKVHKGLLFSPCNISSLVSPGVVVIHDVHTRAIPQHYRWQFVAWYRFALAFLTRLSKGIVTVSHFSESELKKYYPSIRKRIVIAPNAWQHLESVVSDDSIFSRYPEIIVSEYFFTLGSRVPNKNTKWVYDLASNNPDKHFVIAGGIDNRIFESENYEKPANVIELGYVSDGELKSLMSHCAAFLFPTFYEGFGIPPLEAMSCGAPIIVSDTPCMHEIYENQALYIDPTKPQVEWEKLCDYLSSYNPKSILEQYSWESSAKAILHFLREIA